MKSKKKRQKISVDLTVPQSAFARSKSPHPALVGGLGSGKSRAATIRLVLLMAENMQKTGKPVDTLMAMPTYDLLNLRAMPGVEEDLQAIGVPYTTNRSSYSISTPMGTVLFRSYDRPERIVAFEVGHAIADELDTLPIEKAGLVWRKINERVRSKCYRPNSIGVVTTPDQGINGFVFDKWVKRQQKGYELIKASTHSNPYLPDGYIDQIRANYDPQLVEMYLDGEFVSLSQNKVYHCYERAKHHVSREIVESDSVLHVGLDFNIGGTCAVVFVIDVGDPVAVDEFVSHDTYDFCINVIKRYGAWRRIVVYPDASGKSGRTNSSRSDVAIIEDAGFSVDAPNANPAIRDRVNSVNGLLAHNRLKVNSDKCPNLAYALESQGYGKDAMPEKFNTHPAIDDWNDSAGYFIHRRYPIMKPVINAPIGFSL